jgi:hypothetical protein
MESLVTNIRQRLNTNSEDISAEPSLSPPSNSNEGRDFRKVQIPQTRTGLGSTEGDLIFMTKKYLEIVGLVFFVWLLGEWDVVLKLFCD